MWSRVRLLTHPGRDNLRQLGFAAGGLVLRRFDSLGTLGQGATALLDVGHYRSSLEE